MLCTFFSLYVSYLVQNASIKDSAGTHYAPLGTPFTPEPIDHFTATPPELLLHILAFLPPSTLYPLTQTSHYLHTFIQTHAITICNNAILTNYGTAAEILRSTYEESGWLVPTHPAIKNEERRILRDKILFSGCKCPPCHHTIQTSSSSNLSLSDLDTIQGIRGLNCLSGFRPTSCKAKKEIESCLKLSSPGPQYLVFLEKYSWEIVTRHSMSLFSQPDSTSEPQAATAAPSPTGTSSSAASPLSNPTEGSEEENDEMRREREEREKQDAMFEFMVGNYCVRRFLDSAEKALSSFSLSATHTPPPPTPPSARQTQLSKLRAKLQKRLKKSKQRIQIIEADVDSDVEVEEVILDSEEPEERDATVQAQVNPPPRRMMFGEIPPASIPLPPSTSSRESPLMAPTRKVGERWQDGLFWYYSPRFQSSPSLDSGDGDADGDGDKEGLEVVDEKVQKRSCFDVLKKGWGIVGRRIRVLFGRRFVGVRRLQGLGMGFRVLEG